jgi:hypothetical protein
MTEVKQPIRNDGHPEPDYPRELQPKELNKLYINCFDKLTDRQCVIFLYELLGVKPKEIAKRRSKPAILHKDKIVVKPLMVSAQMIKHDKMKIREAMHLIECHDDAIAFLIYDVLMNP